MLISETRDWYYLITWDNPVPASSKKMHAALKVIGHIKMLQTRTTVIFAPRKGVSGRAVHQVVANHLHPVKGNAAIASLRSKSIWHYGKWTGHAWQKAH